MGATLKLKYGVISTDEHVQEAPDVWTSRMSKEKWGSDIPQIVDLEDGSQTWHIRGESAIGDYGVAIVNAAMKPRHSWPRRWEDVPPETYTPSERLKVMDVDEVDTHTFFPNVAGIANQNFQQKGDEQFRLECIRAYNDWLIEEWVEYSPRFIAQCISPMWDVDLTLREIERSVKRGHKAVVWHGAPEAIGLPHFNDEHWFPVYELASDLGVPLCLHLGAVRTLPPFPGYKWNTLRAMGSTRTISVHMQVVANVLFSGVLDRFPKLKTVTVESGIGWIPYLLELSDHEYANLNVAADGLKTKPSEAFRRQMWANFWYEEFGMRNRYEIGVDNIIYETDYPHPTSTWPNSKRLRDHALRDVPADERRKMLMDNAIGLYNLDVDKSALPHSMSNA